MHPALATLKPVRYCAECIADQAREDLDKFDKIFGLNRYKGNDDEKEANAGDEDLRPNAVG